jgi:hypothetical protein
MVIRTMTAVAAAALAFGLTACGGNDGNGGVASANGGTSSSTPSATSTMSPQDAQLAFAQCMRKHGVQVADPKPGGQIALGAKGGSESTTNKALEACRPLLQAGALGAGPNDSKTQDQLLKFAQCMRSHGVDVPDPKPGKGMLMEKPSGSQAKIDAANQACSKYLPGGAQAAAPGEGGPAVAPGGVAP